MNTGVLEKKIHIRFSQRRRPPLCELLGTPLCRRRNALIKDKGFRGYLWKGLAGCAKKSQTEDKEGLRG